MVQPFTSTAPSVPITAHTQVCHTQPGLIREKWLSDSVSIDGNEPVVQLGEAAEPGQFQQLLFGSSVLDSGTEHEVKVTNLPSQTPELSQYHLKGTE